MNGRADFKGAFHHIMAKAYGDEKLFVSAKDYLTFISKLEYVSQAYNLIVYAFCLMPNHIHIFAETPEANLSNAMQRLLTQYKSYSLSRQGKTEGKVFRRRFHSLIVDSQVYAQNLMRYIHLNPVASLVSKPEDWLFSSAADYLTNDDHYDFVQNDLIYQQIQQSKWIDVEPQTYLQSFHSDSEAKSWQPWDYLLGDYILGDEDFFTRTQELLPDFVVDNASKYLMIRDKIARILDFFNRLNHFDDESRSLEIYALKTYTPLTTSEINEKLGLKLSSSSISHRSRRIKNRANSDSKLALVLEDMHQHLLTASKC